MCGSRRDERFEEFSYHEPRVCVQVVHVGDHIDEWCC